MILHALNAIREKKKSSRCLHYVDGQFPPLITVARKITSPLMKGETVAGASEYGGVKITATSLEEFI